ncbi:non-ribosomal peptide synthetase [Streptomyces albidoflavus]|uniref:non-ribosomal peptide synthetase n=2 Tax=Streptomyces TaxID=1883 RepID=UPI001C4F01FD|nr:non-ribosomal peptide synthetase [Streptomyces albidoflavus]QXQ26436.1 amino acid adenylation domain-containing protein [Streptomyces albidoflavus]QXQ32366.1 amino acid adenylation domain-containing protein [Streptomyces albidoflavus]
MTRHETADGTAASREERIAALPAHLREQLRSRLGSRAQDRGAPETIPAAAREDGAPLSPAQERLWYLHEVDPDSIEYNVLHGVRLDGPLDRRALSAALRRLAARHEALRTVFDSCDGVGRQLPRPVADPPLHLHDLTDLPAPERGPALDRLLLDEARTPFDLRRGPLLRTLLVALAPERHALVLSLHHIVTDGWSAGVLTGDLMAYYTAETRGEPAALPELPVQYADYAVWLRERLARPGARRGLGHWRERLDGLQPLDLPTDRPRPAVRSGAGALHPFTVPAPLADRLRALSKERGATVFMTLTAAVELLLSRRSGQTDVAVATAVSGRERPETERMAGFFVNNLVLRTSVDESRPFTALLDSVRSTVLDALEHQDVPYQRVVEELRPERDPSRPALVDVAVNLHNPPGALTTPPELRLSELPTPSVTSSMDLAFDFTERDGELAASLSYNTDLYTPRTARTLATALVRLLERIAAAPHVPLHQVSPLDEDERRRILTEWGDHGDRAASRVATVPELFAEQVAARPFAPAVVSDGETLSYAELDRRADRLARLLAQRGAGPEQLVAVGLPRSVEAVVTVLAVLKCGAAHLPLDLSHPDDRLRLILDDARPSLLVTTQDQVERLAPSAPALALDDPATTAALAAQPEGPPGTAPLAGHPAYAIFTSGSTGRPKGVLVTHQGVHGLVTGLGGAIGAGPGSRVLQFASPGFDAAFYELATALLSGGALVVADRDELLPGDPLAAVLTRHAVTHATLPPSALTAMDPGQLPAGMTLAVAGEACPPETARLWSAGRRMFNAYGPTETTVCATVTGPLDPARLGEGPVPIGHPLPAVRVRLLDRFLRPVPAGVPGEVYLSGAGLARGYLGRPGLTAERFVADPFGAPGARMYRAGDRARWLPDGSVEYLGRTDDQVKLRGFRIEPGEIEDVLARCPGVQAAAVTVRQDTRGVRRLVAYVVTGGSGPDTAALRHHARGLLPEYMVPSAFVHLDALPVNANGKIDRRALPDPGREQGPAGVAPRTGTERVIARIWCELLGVDQVGVEENFFDLGGDSILSLQVVSRARDAGVALTARQTFLLQTVAELAAAADAAAPHPGTPALQRGPVSGPLPATPVQRWFFERLDASLDRFNQTMLLELGEQPDEAALRTVLTALTAHHDGLRLRAEPGGDGWRLRIAETEDGPLLTRTDLGGLPAGRREAAVAEAAARIQEGFPLAEGPLLRAHLLTGPGTPARLLLAAHHLVVDVVSWRVLLEDLETGYAQARSGRPVELPARTASFQEWAVRLREHTAAGGFAEEVAYWKAVEAARAQAGRLPVDLEGANTVATERSVTVRLTPKETEALLRQAPAAYRTRANDLLLSAVWRAVADATGHDAVPVALEGHGRADLFADLDLSRTVGWFTTLYPVVLSADAGAGWSTVLKAVKEQLRAVPSHGVGHGALRWLSGPDGPLAGAGEPEISFNYLGRLDTGEAPGGLVRARLDTEGRERAPGQERPYLIEVNGYVADGVLRFDWAYSSARHHPRTVERMAGAFAEALREIVRHCAEPGSGGATPSDFPLVRLDQVQVDTVTGGGTVEDVYPLTPAQSGMLFHSLSEPERDMYTGHFGVRLDGVADPRALARAWQRVVDRTPALRTSVVWEDVPEPVQVVHRDVEVPVTQLDWRGLPAAERQEALDRYWDERVGRSLDLTSVPLLRLTVVRLTDTSVEMFWSTHHMMVDGWSFSHVLSDVFQEYAAGTAGRAPAPARPPYRQYVSWLLAQDPAAAERYWRQTLKGFTGATPLPYDRAPVQAHSTRSSRERRVVLPLDRSQRLYETARTHRLTVNTLVQGAWAALLARYSGEDEVCFGATVSGRPTSLPGAEAMIGLFIDTVPVRVPVGDQGPALTWLRRIQEEQAEARDFAYAGLADVQRWSGLGETRLFDSIVVFENYPYDEKGATEQGIRIGTYRSDEHTNYPLTLTAHAGDQLTLALGYDPDLFGETTVERLAGHLDRLLDALVTTPQTPLHLLPMLSDEETAHLLHGSNDTAARFPAPRTVPELFAEQALRTPDRVAVRCGTGELTYAQLDAEANRLAHHLVERGVGPGVLVGVCAGRGTGAVTALLAVGRAGGAFVPLDPSYPEDRLALMLQDAAVQLVVTEEELLPRTAASGAVPVCLDRDREQWADRPATAPPGGPAVDDLAYVIYTSGTTGRPKGVMVEHRHLHHMVHAWDARYGLSALEPRVLSVSSLSVDLFFADFLLSALFGGTMVICPSETVADPVALTALLLSSRAELMVTVPTLARAVVQELGWSGVRADHLKVLLVGSEGWPVDSAAEVRAGLGPGTLVANAYGSTETTVDSTAFELLPGRAVDGAHVPIGKPLANTRIYVLDRDRRPVPAGVVGECWIGGDGVSRGYLNRPALTAERFPEDPFAGVPGARMYRTGDLVRRRPDGDLECVGRADDQVKIGGFRVELGEVEAALARHPDIAAAAAVVRPDAAGVGRLVAHLVPRSGRTPDLAAVRAHASALLPAPAVPSALSLLAELPMTPAGTVDRRMLPAPARPLETTTAYEAPQEGAEAVLAEIWAEVLGLERVGRSDNFFALGGDSVMSIRVISRMRALLGVAVSPRQLFDTPTVAGLAQRLDGTASGAPGRGSGPVPTDPEQPAELSSGQQRLWFLHEFAPESSEYHTALALRLRGRPDPDVLRTALTDVAGRHEPLRTVYRTVDGRPTQVVLAPEPVEPVHADLSHLPADAREEAARTYLRDQLEQPIDLGEPPVLRAHLVRLDDDTHLLVLVMHHIATDGWSMDLIAAELGAAYAAAERGEPLLLPALPVRYADYAAWQRTRLEGPEYAGHLAHWRRRLDGTAPLALPVDRPRPAVRSAEGALTMVDLDPAVVDGVRQLARSQDATLFMALVAVVQLLLSRITGQSDIAVATPVSGRGRPELDGLVGFFVNTVVLRTEVDEALSFAGLLDRARTTVLEAFDHAEVPFDRVVEEVRPERDASRNPLAEVSVALESGPGGDLSFGGLAAEPVPLVGSQVSYDLGFEFFEQDGRLTAGISWSTALFDRSTVDRLAERFEALLRGVLTEHRRLTDVPVGPPAAVRTAPAGGGPGELPAEGVVARFEREAALRPDAPAVVAAGERLTFGEAEARANRLARLLAARGIGPERLVAVPGHRTAATVVSLLAVLKTGAAYLPYDPEQPAERLAHQFADAEPALLLGPGAGAWAGAVPSLDPAGPALAAELAGLSAAPLTDAVRTAPADPRDPAYVIYTSGSTGRPKGVVVEHRNLARLAEEHLTVRAGRYPGSAPDGRPRAALTATFAFDSSVVGLLVLAGGGELHVVDDLTRRDPEALVRYVRDHRVDHLEITPTFAEQLVAAGLLRPGGHRPGRVVLGGEAVGEALWTRLAEAEGVLGENTYGPTECTVETLYAPVTADAAPHLGRPLTGTRAHLLDRYLRPVEDGTPGELYLAGGQLGRGYLKRPALTAERFCADPSGPPGARMYRTGDRARRRPDGTLEFLGRADHQVKIRGYRVEPGEIEAVLAALPGTGSAVVTVRPGATGAPRLVAHVTALPGHHLAPAGVRDACRAVLPSYMVPSAVAVLNELPLTASGKVDRARLPEPESAEGPEEGYRAPAEGAERVLAEIWAEVLGRERVGADDNFFDLGGDSVLSLQAVHRVRQAGFRLTSRELFLHPTVAGLATVVTPAGKDADQERGPVSGELPLTPMQQEFLDADPVHPHHFTQSVLAELADGADEEALAAALAELPVRHDMLRARFTHDGTRWRQRIDPGPPGEVPLVRHDLSALPEDERWAAVERLAAEADAGHDLAAGRLWSALLLDLGPGRRRQLFLTVHHLVVDAVSWRVLLDDLATGHAQLRAGEPVRLPGRTTSFQEWARRLRDHTRAGGFDAELPHWRGLPEPAPLPRDRAGEYRHGEVRTVLAELGEEETELLLHRATGLLRAAPRDLVLAGLARVLARWTGQRAVTVDLEGHGREDLFEEVDLSRTVGWFTTLYPVSLDLPGEEAGSGAPEDWKALARAVRRGLRATPGNGLGHGALRRLAEGGAVPGGPGAEVVFNYHGQTDLPHDPEGLFHAFGPTVGLDRSPAAREGHLLEVVGAVSGGRLRLTWYYAETVHHRATVERLAAEHLGLLRAAARHGEER